MEKNKKLEISAENALNAYNNTDVNGRELLEHLFGKELFEPKNIMERVKTFDDACKVLGDNNALVNHYLFIANGPEMDDSGNDIRGYLKLRIIAAALNEGWKPKFDGKERRWYPYFYIYTREEYDHTDAGGAWSPSYASHGSRLAFRTEELAEYCGKQFIDIWMDFLIG